MEKAYDDLEIDQFEKGFTDIGGLKARYMTSRKKDRAIILDDYIKSIQENRKRLGKTPIIYSGITKTWKIDSSK